MLHFCDKLLIVELCPIGKKTIFFSSEFCTDHRWPLAYFSFHYFVLFEMEYHLIHGKFCKKGAVSEGFSSSSLLSKTVCFFCSFFESALGTHYLLKLIFFFSLSNFIRKAGSLWLDIYLVEAQYYSVCKWKYR